MFRTLILATAIAAAVPATPASAESVAVRYGDLDLTSHEGRATLDRRIAAAARSVCRVDVSRDLGEKMASDRCFRAAIVATRTQTASLAVQRVRSTM